MVQERRWLRAQSCQEKVQVQVPEPEEKKSEPRAAEEPVQVSEEQGETEDSRAEVSRRQPAGPGVQQGAETTESKPGETNITDIRERQRQACPEVQEWVRPEEKILIV